MATGVAIKKNLWPLIKANLSLAKGSHAAVGFPGDSAKASKLHPVSKKGRKKGSPAIVPTMTNVDVALANEFGSPPGVRPVVPARPFMRQAFGSAASRQKFMSAGGQLLKMISEGKMSTQVALGRLGRMGQSRIQDEITDPKPQFVPLSIVTSLKKKSTKPLIDTGAMRAAVTYKVRMKSGIGAK